MATSLYEPMKVNAVDLFVTPSLEENLPNTIMEAQACGTPSLGFATGGIPEMISNELLGHVSPYRSADDMADYIIDTGRRAMTKTGRKRPLEALRREALQTIGCATLRQDRRS